MYWKEGGWQDYAPKGMPDFDQRQLGWDYPTGTGAGWFKSGPVAAANSLWWFDSKFELNGQRPPTVSDSYGLVKLPDPAVAWDDHDPRNVQPLVNALGALMGTAEVRERRRRASPAVSGSILPTLTVTSDYTVSIQANPAWTYVGSRVRESQDVILLLGFWQEDKGLGPRRIGGNYVTVSGVDLVNNRLGISDPYRNAAESGGAGSVLPGAHSALHPAPSPLGDTVHNDAQYISQDVYAANLTGLPTGMGGGWALEGYTNPAPYQGCPQINPFEFLNTPPEFDAQEASCNQFGMPLWTTVEYAIAVAPKANTVIGCPTTNIAAVTGSKLRVRWGSSRNWTRYSQR